MTSRERVIDALNFKKTDRVPVDFGASLVSGINASLVYKLREHYKLPCKDIETTDFLQMLGKVDDDLLQILHGDVIGLNNPVNSIGNSIIDQNQRFIMPDGTPTLIPNDAQYDICSDESIVFYPQGDRTCNPSVKMPKNGLFFDSIDRSKPIDESNLTPIEDFKESFGILTDETAKYFEKESKKLFESTDYAVIGNFGGGALGSPALLPGPNLKNPKGIRKIDEWLMAHLLFPDYVKSVLEYQTENYLKNIEIYKQAVGERIQLLFISGTDFGTQKSLFISKNIFQNIYKPLYKRMNDWIHQNTNWKTFFHSCGAISEILDDFVEMGVDIVNPVQTSAENMDAKTLKAKYHGRLVFWGGGIDTQKILPYGNPQEVYENVMENLAIFSEGGGYVFNTIHNMVGNIPMKNIEAMLSAIKDFNENF